MAALDTPPSRWRIFAYHPDHAGRGPMFVGLAVLVPILLAFVLWSSLAPLNSAAIATGEIVLSSERKTVQHLEGGLVTEIFVREGMRVEAGQPLLVVQDLAERTRIAALVTELLNINAQIARLLAERDGALRPDFSDIATGLDADAETVSRFVDLHMSVFDNLTETESALVDLTASRKVQIRREIEGLQAQLTAKEREAQLVEEELANKQELFERGFSSEIQINAVARVQAALEGEIGALRATMAKLEQSILDQDVALLQTHNDRRSALLDELQAASVAAETLRQEMRNLTDRQNRAVIRAPASGVVLGMQVHTIGAVVAPGTPMMDIVPEEDDLIISAQVSPTDIDLVEPGNSAKVQLSAYRVMKVDKLDAIVETVSGDILTDEMTGVRYFEARLRVSEETLSNLPPTVELTPGMPADVFLIAGERTLAEYILSPILGVADRAFRED